jgi:hypothetical protein
MLSNQLEQQMNAIIITREAISENLLLYAASDTSSRLYDDSYKRMLPEIIKAHMWQCLTGINNGTDFFRRI